MRNNIEMTEEVIEQLKHDIKEADMLWIDRLVQLGGMAWTLEHISFLCYKLKYFCCMFWLSFSLMTCRSRRKSPKDKTNLEKLVSLLRKMMVSKVCISFIYL